MKICMESSKCMRRAREGVMGEVTFELALECLRSLPVLIWRD